MARTKVKLAFIKNESARKTTFKKRKKNLLKKASELSTLCGIRACVMIYSVYDIAPEIWPSQREAQQVVEEFKRIPEMEHDRKMVDQESFMLKRLMKTNERLMKTTKENRKKEVKEVMLHCLSGRGLNNFTVEDLNDVHFIIDQNVNNIDVRIEALKNGSSSGCGVIPGGGEFLPPPAP